MQRAEVVLCGYVSIATLPADSDTFGDAHPSSDVPTSLCLHATRGVSSFRQGLCHGACMRLAVQTRDE